MFFCAVIGMDPLVFRVARRFTMTRRGARPVPIDKEEIERLVNMELVPDIVAWMKRHHPKDQPVGSTNTIAKAMLSVEAADGRSSTDVLIGIRCRSSRHRGGAVIGGGFGTLQGKPVIVLDLNGVFTPEEFVSEKMLQPLRSCRHEMCLPYALYANLLHEVTHAADDPVFKGKPSAKHPGKSELPNPDEYSDAEYARYINHPSEVRAWMQQVVDETMSAARIEAIRNRAQRKPNPNQELVNLALRLSATWTMIEKHLTPSNRAKILKAVHHNLDRLGLLF